MAATRANALALSPSLSDASAALVTGETPKSWVRLGVTMVGIGYALMAAYGFAFLGRDLPERLRETAVAVIAGAAFIVAGRRPRTASLFIVGAVWCELLLSLAHLGMDSIAALMVVPSLIPVVGMLVSGRAAVLLSCANAILVPLALVAHQSLTGKLWSDVLSNDNSLPASVILSLSMGLIVHTAVRSYKGALERLERAHQRYRSLFKNAPDGLIEMDDGLVQHMNPIAMRLLAVTRLPNGPRLEDLLRASGVVHIPRLHEARPGSPMMIEVPSPTGPPRTLEFTVRDPEAHGTASLVVLRDVSERRATEAQMQHNQRLETVGHLAGGVAHDFNNLLTVVGGNATMLADHKDPDVQELAKEILFAQERGAALTRQLLTFARKELRRPESFDLAATVDGMARLIRRLVGEQIQLKIDYAGQVLVLADRAQVEQVVFNLVANGRDAIEGAGELRITVRVLSASEASELGSCLSDFDQALLAVTDTGRGMTAETKARLFEPFFTTKLRGEGTGLGLATVHGIVAQSGGALFVQSDVGQPTTFRIFLPLHAGEVSGVRALPALERDGGGSGTILVVEDEPEVRDLARRVLERAGYSVVSATTAGEALLVLASRSFDLVLTDIVMPGITGLQLAEKLHVQAPRARMLFMSGYFDHASPSSLKLDPKKNLLEKPFTPQELLGRVKLILRTP